MELCQSCARPADWTTRLNRGTRAAEKEQASSSRDYTGESLLLTIKQALSAYHDQILADADAQRHGARFLLGRFRARVRQNLREGPANASQFRSNFSREPEKGCGALIVGDSNLSTKRRAFPYNSFARAFAAPRRLESCGRMSGERSAALRLYRSADEPIFR